MSKYLEENAKAHKGEIVLIGDSMVEYYDVDEYYDYDDVHVYNRGVAGETSGEMMLRFEEDALNLQPHILFIQIGTNDITMGERDKTIANLANAIDMAKSSGIEHILLASLLPVNTDICSDLPPVINDYIMNLSKDIEKLAIDSSVDYINFYPKFLGKDGMLINAYTHDGIHLNADGYDVYTHVLKPYIRRYLNDKH